MNIYEKLNKARSLFHSAQIKKSGHNKFAGYSYFELGDFIVPALKICAEVGITPVIKFAKDMATMEMVNTSDPSEKIEFSSPMSEAALKGCHPVQNLGAVETYVRRYLWVAALEIVEHDAVDSSQPKEEVKEEKKDKKPEPQKKKKEEDIPETGEAFLEILIKWAEQCVDPEELSSIWKANQKKIDGIKKTMPEQYKDLVDRFTTMKNNLLKM